eukprot:gi/632989373/ref/XP_007883617.1/ PREDICTED: uncharacterized protein LOC103172695 [Callorhinchus milii]
MITMINPMITVINPMITLINPMITVINPMITVINPMITVINPMITVINPMITVINPMITVINPMITVINPMITVINPMITVINPMITVINPMITVINPMITVINPMITVINPMIHAITTITMSARSGGDDAALCDRNSPDGDIASDSDDLPNVLMPFDSVFLFRASGWEPPRAPPVLTARAGEAVNVSCYTEGEIELVEMMRWYKQAPGQALRPVDMTAGCPAKACKYSSRVARPKVLMLHIVGVQAGDSGWYYCAELYARDALFDGTSLVVADTESATARPSLLVFAPPEESRTGGFLPLVCVVSGMPSNLLPAYWNVSGRLTEGLRDRETAEPDGTFGFRSQIRVPARAWFNGSVYACVVPLGSSAQTVERRVRYPAADKGERRLREGLTLTVAGIPAFDPGRRLSASSETSPKRLAGQAGERGDRVFRGAKGGG